MVDHYVTLGTCDQIFLTFNYVCVDGNECFGIPCLNGGTCVDQLQNYRCECPRIFSGVNCEEDLASMLTVFYSACIEVRVKCT